MADASNRILSAALLAGLTACGGGAAPSPDAALGGALQLEPHVELGTLVFGAAPIARDLAVTNVGAAPERVLTARIEGPDAGSFTISAAGCATLDPGRSCHLALTAAADREGALQAMLIVEGDRSRAAATLTGTGQVDGHLIVAQRDPDFGRVTIGLAATQAPRLAFAVVNTGAGALPTPSVSIEEGGAFHLLSTTCRGIPLRAGEQCAFTVDFQPTRPGPQQAILKVRAGAQTWQGPVAGWGDAALTVTRGGSGDGTVDGPGWSCGATCRVLPDRSPVVLTATAATGSTFAGWGGAAAACGALPTCAVAIDRAAVSVEATFTALTTAIGHGH